MSKGVSIVICTYNGAALLPETIRHVALQRVRKDIDWEVIIIDNASTDNTSLVAAAEWGKYRNPVSFTLLHQPKQGLTYARELAIKKSKYEFVLFCDDDNWLESDYINVAYDIMLQHQQIGVLGGCGDLEFESTPPTWAVGLSSLAGGPQATCSGKVMYNAVYGAGFVMRKAAFKAITKAGFKPILTDRLASNLSSGGDHEICYAIALAGYDIWYEEKLKFKHFIPKKRVTWDYCARLYKEGAQCLEVLLPYRMRVNKGCRNMLSFNLNLILNLLSHIRRLLVLLMKRELQDSDSKERILDALKMEALKARIMSFKSYAAMKKNFKYVLCLEQHSLEVVRSRKVSKVPHGRGDSSRSLSSV